MENLKEASYSGSVEDCSQEERNSTDPIPFPCRKEALMVMTDDAMACILLRLPLKSLLKAKCVCKWWNQLISDPLFVSNYSNQYPQHNVSGFFLQKLLMSELYSKLEFITCAGQLEAAPRPSLSFIEDVNGVYVQHSFNGLLLCSSLRCHEEDRKYYVCKPTTKQYWPLPRPGCKTIYGIQIVYDPSKSPHYKVICICNSETSKDFFQIKIYECFSGSWRDSVDAQYFSCDFLFNRGVLWKNALHWVGRGKLSLQFHIEQEHLHTMPMPPIPEGWSERRLAYFGESGGHLYLIENYSLQTTRFKVMEMKSDCSGWFVKYHVDLSSLTLTYPSMVRRNVREIHRHLFSILYIVDQDVGDEDDSFMVLHIPGNFVTYNLRNQEVKELRSFSYDMKVVDKSLGLWYSWEGVYPYVNTLCYL